MRACLPALFYLLALAVPILSVPNQLTRQVPEASLARPEPRTPAKIPALDIQVCGTGDPSQGLRNAHGKLRVQARFERLGNGTRMQPRAQMVVDLYVHFVTTLDQAHNYPASVRTAVIQNQVTVLNRSFSPLGVVFRLHQSTYTIKDSWATDVNSTQMKNALRQGTYGSLNIYFQTNLSSAGSVGQTLLGYCTLPTTITYNNGNGQQIEYPAADYSTDGCNVLAGSMPGIPNAVNGYDEGKTAVHETGHWFGLLHTFQDDTCNPSDPGDYVDDTPIESVATSGCPTGKDSCLNDPGVDPINNYMDYSTDECYTNFTPEQQQRMLIMYTMYRKGN